MAKEKFKKVLYLSLIIIWMLTVFMFSNQDGGESQRTSKFLTGKIVQILTFNQNITEEQEIIWIEKTDYIVRKLAHFSIYTLGGILIYNYINTFNIKHNRKIVITIIIGALYASFDEFHQYFVSDRSAQVLDVCIDSLGVIAGGTLTYLTKNLLINNYSKGEN